VLALVVREADSPFSDDVGELGFDFLSLFGREIGGRLRLVRGVMPGVE